MLINLKLKKLKIPSSEINNSQYLKHISKFKKDIIFSTGMSSLKDIKYTFDFLLKNGVKKKNLTILHCNSEYPTPYSDVNLNAIKTIKNKFNVKVGYSDHSIGIEVAIAAVALGAEVIEKHFTLDKKMHGPDHKASSDPKELYKLIKSIRNIENSLGKNQKKITRSENKNIKTHQKSIVSKKIINKGDRFTEKNLTTKRPGNGLSSKFYFHLIGKKSKFSYGKDSLLKKSELNK